LQPKRYENLRVLRKREGRGNRRALIGELEAGGL